jgi:hypothetical protein
VAQRRDQLRAADVDRAFVADLLKKAVDEGRLSLNEYDERLRHTYDARTYGDLDQIIADLPRPSRRTALSPAASTVPISPVSPGGSARKESSGLTRAWSVWALVVGINVLVWMFVSLVSTDWVYPWPLWVAGPWGIVLLVSTVMGRRP